jgi:hypothetical protein
MAPMKTRRVVDLIRGLPANEALNVLRFSPQAASEPVYKVLASAIANAEQGNINWGKPEGRTRRRKESDRMIVRRRRTGKKR